MWTPSRCKRWWRWGAGDAFANTWSSVHFRWKPTPQTQKIKGRVSQDRSILVKTHSFDYNVHAHAFLRDFGWFLLFGINGWRCRLMCVFQKEAASVGEKTFEMRLKRLQPIAIIKLTRLQRTRFDFSDDRAAAWRDPEKVAVKGKKLIILLKDVQASLLPRWLHLLFHQPEC